MKGLIDNANRPSEKAFLVGAEFAQGNAWEMEDSLAELAELSRTAGAEVVGQATQKLDRPHPATFVGTGKADEIARSVKAFDADTIIFDDELSPAQARNLEKILESKVLDRTSLILDIFAQRAQTKEGKLQVELAQLQHLYPRLTRFWGHLSRQRGGIGMRGDGETQLETDRRRVQDKMTRLREELDVVRRQRQTRRVGRQRRLWPLASIVGYTNAGKSTLLNRLTDATVLSEDKLFATLDPTTRRLRLPTNQNILLSDTVGFIRKLPHSLVEAFKATLEEVVEADLLIHVVDGSSSMAEEQIAAVNLVLNELDAGDKPTLMVANKVDQLEDLTDLRRIFGEQVIPISAKTGEGIDHLMREIGAAMRPIRRTVHLAIPHEDAALMARLHAVGEVVERDYSGAKATFTAHVPPHYIDEFEDHLLEPPDDHRAHPAD